MSDDETNQDATNDAFDVLHFIAAKRLKRGLLTVIDATNVQLDSRKPIIRLAREYHCIPVAIVLNLPEKICKERNEKRSDRNFRAHVLRSQARQLKRSLKSLKKEGFRHVYILRAPEEVESATILREPLWCDKRDEHGPFDIIGDVHGCFEELSALLQRLGYQITQTFDPKHIDWKVEHPEGRKAVFLGDLVDRGPYSPAVLRLVMSMVHDGIALCVPGNHDVKLQKYLAGKNVQIKHGLEQTIELLQDEPEELRPVFREFLYSLVSHLLKI